MNTPAPEPHRVTDDADLAALITELGTEAVRTDVPTRTLVSTDRATVQEHHLPRAAVFARTTQEVQAVLRWASEHRVPVVPRGAGSGISGGAHATAGCIVLSLERMNRVLEVDAEAGLARVQPGVINGELNALVAEQGLMFAPDPASSAIATIGGNIATNAGGLRCVKYGVTRDAVLGLTVVLANGALLTTGGRTLKDVSGYDLTGLIVGSEGTLGIVVEATVRLLPLPLGTAALSAFFPDLPAAIAGMSEVFAARLGPAIVELLDGRTLRFLEARDGAADALSSLPRVPEGATPDGGGLLLFQFDGSDAAELASRARETLAEAGALLLSPEGDPAVWELLAIRKATRGADSDTQLRVGEDITVPRPRLAECVAGLEEIAASRRVGLRIIAHAGDGNLHPTFFLEPEESDRIGDLGAALDDSVRLALELDGTITGEHGVGQFKLRWFREQHDAVSAGVHRQIKQALDPLGILNPGKAFTDDTSPSLAR